MNIDDIIDFSTFMSIAIAIFGWILILLTIPMVFINSGLAQLMFISGMVIMVVGTLMTFMVEPLFRLIYRYLLKRN
jgi:hypothetical protein